MDRTIASQVTAMLVMLAMLSRWIPPGTADEVAADYFGRGAPQLVIDFDVRLAQEPNDRARRSALLMKGRDAYFRPRYHQLLKLIEEEVLPQAQPGDVLQMRNLARNEIWMFSYYLYPVRVIGTAGEDGGRQDDPVDPAARWLLTGGEVVEASQGPVSLPSELERLW